MRHGLAHARRAGSPGWVSPRDALGHMLLRVHGLEPGSGHPDRGAGGYDVDFERCQLTGAPPHAPPDTAYSPPGWTCAPLQTKHDSTTFTLGWRVAPVYIGSVGIGPKSMMT